MYELLIIANMYVCAAALIENPAMSGLYCLMAAGFAVAALVI